jgi:hypothetical protein
MTCSAPRPLSGGGPRRARVPQRVPQCRCESARGGARRREPPRRPQEPAGGCGRAREARRPVRKQQAAGSYGRTVPDTGQLGPAPGARPRAQAISAQAGQVPVELRVGGDVLTARPPWTVGPPPRGATCGPTRRTPSARATPPPSPCCATASPDGQPRRLAVTHGQRPPVEGVTGRWRRGAAAHPRVRRLRPGTRRSAPPGRRPRRAGSGSRPARRRGPGPTRRDPPPRGSQFPEPLNVRQVNHVTLRRPRPGGVIAKAVTPST